jgi:hypothetical protein
VSTPLSARSELPRGPASCNRARGQNILSVAATEYVARFVAAPCNAVTLDGQVVLRSNVSADVLRSFGEDLKNLADELTAPPEPGDTAH